MSFDIIDLPCGLGD